MYERTKKLKRDLIIATVAEFLLNVFPVLYYTLIGISTKDIAAGKKVTLTLAAMFAGALLVINLITKHSMRSPLYIVLLGLYICLDNVLPVIVMILVCTIIDELFVTNIRKRISEKYRVNKEIDRREQERV